MDGQDVTDTNIAEEQPDRTLSVYNVRLHLLSQGDEFDLLTRTPTRWPAREVEEELIGAADDKRDASRFPLPASRAMFCS